MSKEILNKFIEINNDSHLGYEIHTSEQVISILISNYSLCCENWGIITTEDSLQDFVGSELLSIEVVDMDYKTHPLTMNFLEVSGYNDETGICFIDINTSSGKLQFVLYNKQNGYYGHHVTINSNQFKHNDLI